MSSLFEVQLITSETISLKREKTSVAKEREVNQLLRNSSRFEVNIKAQECFRTKSTGEGRRDGKEMGQTSIILVYSTRYSNRLNEKNGVYS